jgi:hypothetical protein
MTTKRDNNSKTLYHCPWCGSPGIIVRDFVLGGYRLECAQARYADPESCPVGPQSSRLFATRKDALHAWNTRVQPRRLKRDELKRSA